MVLLRNQNLGIKTTIVEQDLTGFICRGLDVCDFFGLFSVLGHPELAAIYRMHTFQWIKVLNSGDLLNVGYGFVCGGWFW